MDLKQAEAHYDAHVQELKHVLAMLVVRHGEALPGGGFQLELDAWENAELAAQISPSPIVIISATDGPFGDRFVVDVL